MAVAWLDCEIRHMLALGSHTWFVGEVVDCGEPSPALPMRRRPGAGPGVDAHGRRILRMEDTRMNYGG